MRLAIVAVDAARFNSDSTISAVQRRQPDRELERDRVRVPSAQEVVGMPHIVLDFGVLICKERQQSLQRRGIFRIGLRIVFHGHRRDSRAGSPNLFGGRLIDRDSSRTTLFLMSATSGSSRDAQSSNCARKRLRTPESSTLAQGLNSFSFVMSSSDRPRPIRCCAVSHSPGAILIRGMLMVGAPNLMKRSYSSVDWNPALSNRALFSTRM